MHKSISNVLLKLFGALLPILLIIIFLMSISTEIKISDRTIKINIINGIAFCEDIMVIDVDSSNRIEYKYFKDYFRIKNVQGYINDIPITNSNQIALGKLNLPDSWTETYNVLSNKATIKITYELDGDYITRYNDIDYLPVSINYSNVEYLNNLSLVLTSDSKISNLETKGAQTSKVKNTYYINVGNISKPTNIELFFNIDTRLLKTINYDYNYYNSSIGYNEYSFIYDRLPILIGCAIVSLLLWTCGYLINKKPKIYNYRRETSDLLSPVLAEAVIDGKIGLKELIMTTIIDLHIRGNIKIISNKDIELITGENLEGYEREIINLLFKDFTKISFEDINNIFIDSNKATLKFSDTIKFIKDSIFEKLTQLNIFSKELSLLNKIISLLAVLICVNIPMLFFKNIIDLFTLFLITDVLIIVAFFFPIKNTSSLILGLKGKEKNSIAASIKPLIFIFGFLIVSLYFAYKSNITTFIITLLIYALNIYTALSYKKSVLTKQGKLEKAKLLELKKFITEHSLLEERDLRSVIIWDKYLAYATAFGIPSAITNTIFEHWYNLNIFLQILENL